MTPGQRTEAIILAPKAGSVVLQSDVQTLAKFGFAKASMPISVAGILPYTKIMKVDKTRTLNIKGVGMGMMGMVRVN